MRETNEDPSRRGDVPEQRDRGSFIPVDPEQPSGREALEKSEQRLRLASSAARLGLWDYNPRTRELISSEINNQLYGFLPHQEVEANRFFDCMHPEDRARVDASIAKLIDGAGQRLDVEFRIVRPSDGAVRWLKIAGAMATEDDDPRLIGISLDVTDSKTAELRLREASQHDQLTGLPGRRLLFEYCSHLMAMANRTNSNGAMLFIDLDRFKPINDNHGHAVGDLVLQQVARRLVECVRKEDIVGRLGGDEFVVALPHPDDRHGPATVARNIIESLSQPFQIGALQLHLSASIGISMYPRHGTDLDSLIKTADKAMYQAKKQGRNCYRFYNPGIEDDSDDADLRIEKLLREALLQNSLALMYQPVVDMQTGITAGAEAFLRLPVPDAPSLQPHVFLPIAEACGLINSLGDWVLNEACRQHRLWHEAGLPPMSISINIASQQFRQRSFVHQLRESLSNSGMEPGSLQIELTESTVLEDVPEAMDSLARIRELGVKIALDDFGIGFSSLGLLSKLPLDKLKIDQSFVQLIGHDTKSQAIADSVLALGRTLRLQVVGEGVESEAAFSYLQDHGCNQAQGFYLSKPLSAGEFEQWCKQEQSHAQAVH